MSHRNNTRCALTYSHRGDGLVFLLRCRSEYAVFPLLGVYLFSVCRVSSKYVKGG